MPTKTSLWNPFGTSSVDSTLDIAAGFQAIVSSGILVTQYLRGSCLLHAIGQGIFDMVLVKAVSWERYRTYHWLLIWMVH